MIQQALLSVSNKTGIVEFARALAARGIALLSTGGTAQYLARAGIPVTRIAARWKNMALAGLICWRSIFIHLRRPLRRRIARLKTRLNRSISAGRRCCALPRRIIGMSLS